MLEFDIAIIGGGCIGSSILHELCCCGFDNTVLVDYGRKTSSATANSGGMIRVFHENIEHLDLALGNMAFIEAYHRLGILTEKTEINGSLYFFNKKRHATYKENFYKMKQSHYPFELITYAQGLKRFPHYEWHADEYAVYEPLARQLSPRQFCEDLLRKSTEYGAVIFDDFEVTKLNRLRDRFEILSNKSKIIAKTIILAGGAKFVSRLKDLGIDLPYSLKSLTAYIAKKIPNELSLPNYFDRENLDFAAFGQQVLLSQPDNKRIKEKTWSEIIEIKQADDCYAPNRIGLLGKLPGHPGIILASGWGGTAFKFSLEIAHRVVNAIDTSYSRKQVFYA